MIGQNTYIKWMRWGLLNLVIVAILGTIMRYKIAFGFPFLDQKNLLHAHSHFAFSAWLTHMFYCGLMSMASSWLNDSQLVRYNQLIMANLLSALGMLVAFVIGGYNPISIFFSTMTIVVAVIFCVRFFKDAKVPMATALGLSWAKIGLLLNVISVLGPLYLAYMMIMKDFHADYYLASVYYFLHFQYNGWFFFSAMALALHLLPPHSLNLNKHFKAFVITIIPTYGLSILWVKPPFWLYILIVIATLIQLATWFHLLYKLIASRHLLLRQSLGFFMQFFIIVALIAVSIKFVLQTISVIPSLSQLVFGLRPIVIAYLHLVLLGVYTMFILFYGLKQSWLIINPFLKWALLIFFTGVFCNELFLGIQGLASFTYTVIPFINEGLFLAAIILFIGAVSMLISQRNLKINPAQS